MTHSMLNSLKKSKNLERKSENEIKITKSYIQNHHCDEYN